MNEEQFIALIYKSIKGEISNDESTRLDEHTNLSEDNAILRAEIEDSWLFSQDNSAILNDVDVEKDLQIVTQKMGDTSSSQSNSSVEEETKVVPISRNSITRRLAFAASFLLLVTAGYFLTKMQNEGPAIYASNDKTLSIDLADGSEIVLNKNSQLIVAQDFSETNRNVELIGEAFFDVESDQAHPFEITAGESTVTVLGTSFNVRVDDDNCVVGVTSGKVKLSDTEGTNEVTLTKNEVGRHSYGDDRVGKYDSPAENFNYWQKQNVVFKNTSIESIVSQLALMYGAGIQVQNGRILDCKVSVVSNEVAIDKVLSKVFLSLNAEIERIDDKTFVIKNGTCK